MTAPWPSPSGKAAYCSRMPLSEVFHVEPNFVLVKLLSLSKYTTLSFLTSSVPEIPNTSFGKSSVRVVVLFYLSSVLVGEADLKTGRTRRTGCHHRLLRNAFSVVLVIVIHLDECEMLQILFGLAILCEQLNLLVTGPDVRFRALDLVHERLDVVRGEMEVLPHSHGFLASTAQSVFTRLVPSLFSSSSLLLVLVRQTRQLQMRWGTIFPKLSDTVSSQVPV